MRDENAALIHDVPAFVRTEPEVVKSVHACTRDELRSAAEGLMGVATMTLREGLEHVDTDAVQFVEAKSEGDFVGDRAAALFWFAKMKFGDE